MISFRSSVLAALVAISCRTSASALPVISEFMAINQSSLQDEDGNFSDWIEIHNPDAVAVNLEGWHLTDSVDELDKWTFPSVTIAPGGFLVVFASNENRTDALGELHTNFKLSGEGGFLALVSPDGGTLSTNFSPYPQQVVDVGYGMVFAPENFPALEAGAPVSAHVPNGTSGPAMGEDWWLPDYFEGAQGEVWKSVESGVGFGSNYSGLIGAGGNLASVMLDTHPGVYLRAQFTVNNLADIDALSLRLKYDDGFVAYLNGEEVARANAPSKGGAPVTGLVALYDFDGDLNDDADKFTNGSGVFADDLSPFGTAAYEAGIAGQAVKITGGGLQRLRAADSDDLDLASSWTLEAFVKPDSNNTDEWDRFWTKWGDGGDEWHWTFRGTNNGLDLFINGSNNILNHNSTGSIPLNEWSHVAVVGDQSKGTITAWRNGVRVGSAPWQQVSNGGGAMNFGNFNSPVNNLQFSGLIDEAAIWSVALTPEQLAEHAAAINGAPADSSIAYGLTPIDGGSGLDWNSTAASDRPDLDALKFVQIDLTSRLDLLNPGVNLLAIHGLNANSNADHFLILPEIDLVGLSADAGSFSYLSESSPGAANPVPTTGIGPVIGAVGSTANLPGDGDDITVNAVITETFSPVSSVVLNYRVNFGAEIPLTMSLDGAGNYTATIPASASAPGDMVRWRVTATDEAGSSTNNPPFPDPNASPKYDGVAIASNQPVSELPVLQWFIQSPAAAESGSGTRASLSFNGEFYDNVFVRIRGDTARSWPKKSYKFDFNDGHNFRFDPNLPRVNEINVNTTYTDKSYSRTILAYETFRDSGSPYSISFPLRVEQNGRFYSLAVFVEQADRDYLRRNGLDDDGALYKAKANSIRGVGNFAGPATSGMQKKNRREEDFSDLQTLINNLALNGDALETYLFDNVDIPAVVNNLAANVVIQNIDRTVKNFYLYRDSEGSGEWMIFPWDVDLSFGPNALNTNVIVTSEDRGNNSSHPFMGSSTKPYTSLWNGLIDAMIDRPETREMFLRRLSTLGYRFLGTNYYESRLDELVGSMEADVLLDRARWGNSAHFSGSTLSLKGETDRIRNEYLPGRRFHLFQTHGGSSGSGLVLVPENSPVTALVPRDGSLGDSWRAAGFDDSGWISGVNAVGYERSLSGNYTPLLGLDLLSPSIPASLRIDSDGDNSNDNNSCYLRYEFNLLDAGAIEFLKFRVKYDDGFVAYLNGVQIAARNAPSPLSWDAEASGSNPDSAAVIYEDIDVSNFTAQLQNGTNVLAVQAMNRGSNGSDMLFSATLLDESFGNGSGVGIPGSQPATSTINFGSIEVNPASGNQDEEFITLENPNAYSVDVSGWQVSGGVEMVLKPGTVIPAGGNLFLSPDVTTFRARGVSPKGGEGLFVQGGYQGHLSNFGEVLALSTDKGVIVSQSGTDVVPSDAQLYLVISEFHYHPAGDSGEEFIELSNISNSVTLDLTGVKFTSGVSFNFSGSLAPGARILIVRNQVAFEARYGTGLPVVGEFADFTSLNNDGELLKIEDATNSTVIEFTYNDKEPWPVIADGGGASLILVNPNSKPDPDNAINWRPSIGSGGNPGLPDSKKFVGDPDADLNGNGLADLVDHALFGPSAPTLTTDPSGVRFEFVRDLAADDVISSIEISTDLETWIDGAGLLELVQSVPTGDGGLTMTYGMNPANAPDSKYFLRLKVELIGQ